MDLKTAGNSFLIAWSVFLNVKKRASDKQRQNEQQKSVFELKVEEPSFILFRCLALPLFLLHVELSPFFLSTGNNHAVRAKLA